MLVSLPKYPRDIRSCRPWNRVAASDQFSDFRDTHPGWADLVVFDPGKIEDHATFEKPQQYATGVSDVFVNGVQVLKDGVHTGAKPGRVVYGPGRK
jgi:hypothetical protein